MGRNENSKRLAAEFREFESYEATPVPRSLTDSLLAQIRADLNPPATAVFVKVALIHFVVGLVTLAICPQFGLSLTSSHGLMPYLMRFGESVCMLGCGAFYMGSGLLIAALALKPEEVRVLRKNRVLQIATLTILSLGAFICFGGEVVASLGFAWALGALVGGSSLLQLGWMVRRLAVQRAV